jgi:dTDP-glucose 4,6-dehydratase
MSFPTSLAISSSLTSLVTIRPIPGCGSAAASNDSSGSSDSSDSSDSNHSNASNACYACYTPKNILVTGGAGFIGSHFVQLLSQKYPAYNVVVLDKMDYCASQQNLVGVNSNVKLIVGDICDLECLTNALTTFDIDTVVHFAAQSHVDTSFGNSLTFTHNNVYGTHVLLEASRSHGKIKRFVNVSTDEVYGDLSLGLKEGLKEGSVLEPTNPYAASKAGAEMVCRSYIKSYKMPIIITRGNNVYGRGQHPEKLIPKMITLIKDGKDLPIHGDGTALRSYLHVSDVARAFDTVLHCGKDHEIYNIGTEVERSVKDVVCDIVRMTGYDASRIRFVEDRPFQDKRYFVRSDKLAALGWKQQVDWEAGMCDTINWYGVVDAKTYWPRT